MATIREAVVQQGTREVRRWVVDFTDDLPTGGNIVGGTAIHTPPGGGTAGTPTITYTDNAVTAILGPLTSLGIHYLDVQGIYSDGEKSEVRIAFTVNYQPTAARDSMADMVSLIRRLTNTSSNEYSIAGQPHWTDYQLQTVLDRHVKRINYEELMPFQKVGAGGSVAYFEYHSPRKFFESTEGGTARFIVQDENGGTVAGSAYSVDYQGGVVTFGLATSGMPRYVTGYSYDSDAAASEIWTQKAAHYSMAYDISTDNHSLSRSQIIKNCMMMAKEFASHAEIRSAITERSDTNSYNYYDLD